MDTQSSDLNIANIEHLFGRKEFTFSLRDVSDFIWVPGDVDVVMHFASPASPVDYLEMPIQTLKVGSLGTHNSLGLAKEKGAKFFIASTSEVYGDPQVHPQTEDYWGNVNPVGPRGVYDEAKRFSEAITMAYHRYHGLDTRIVRIFNTYGPRQSARAVIPTVITQIANKKRKIKLGALKPTRDFNYVEDTVSGFVAALESDKAIGEVVNLGSNFEISIGDTANTIADLMGTDIEILTDHQRLRPDKSEVERLWADNTKAKQLLKWQPKYGGITGFRKGLEKTVEWFIDQSNLKTYKSDQYIV